MNNCILPLVQQNQCDVLAGDANKCANHSKSIGQIMDFFAEPSPRCRMSGTILISQIAQTALSKNTCMEEENYMDEERLDERQEDKSQVIADYQVSSAERFKHINMRCS